MKQHFISGIQQVGVGIPAVYEAWKWYRKAFGVDIPVFDEAAEAALMLPYTGGQPRSRHAVLALNIQGGGGMEIWQYTSRVPQPANFDIQLGDLGIYITKIKSRDVKSTYELHKSLGLEIMGTLNTSPEGTPHFYVKDPYGNIFQVVPGDDWFRKNKQSTGAVYGCVIGVSDMDRSMKFYSELLGYDTVVYDETKQFDDFKILAGGTSKCRRVLLRHSQERVGSFSRLLGKSEIELVQTLDREPVKMFKDRLWGDLGFIHLCFDIKGMDALGEVCKSMGHPFTVDSGSFDMGEAAGRFTYIDDPDGTLIEFVEAYKIPILKKINWYLDLRKRDPKKSLPKWMLNAMALNRVKD